MPAQMSSAAPIVGKSAAYPGNAVLLEKRTAAHMIAARPIQPMPARQEAGIRLRVEPAIANEAPRANSHARAKVEKYVALGDTGVS